MGFRDNYSKTIEDLYIEELNHLHPYNAMQRAKYRHRMYANLFTRDVRKKLLTKESVCAICKSADRLNIDHIIPVSKGGRNEINNVQILCFKCNRKKSDK